MKVKIKEKQKNGKIRYSHVKRDVASNTKPHRCECELGMQHPTRNEPLFRQFKGKEIVVTNAPIFKCDICESLELSSYVEKKLERLCEEAVNKGVDRIEYS
jgi:hypothetical protein